MQHAHAPWLFDRPPYRVHGAETYRREQEGFNAFDRSIGHFFMTMYFWNTIELWRGDSDGDFPN